MFFGYNTNSLVNHSLEQAIELVASIGYRSIAITVDHYCLNPFAGDYVDQLAATKELLAKHHLVPVVELGAPYILDGHRKHEPTYVSADAAGRERRVDFLCRGIDLARELDAVCASTWSGAVRDGCDDEEAFARLVSTYEKGIAYAYEQGVAIGFEPEPDMFINSADRFEELLGRLSGCGEALDALQLTLDLGHFHCVGDIPLADMIHRFRDRLVNVHIEDMVSGIHKHLPFGEGEMDFPPAIAALQEIGYAGPVNVELSLDSFRGPEIAASSFEYLQSLVAP